MTKKNKNKVGDTLSPNHNAASEIDLKQPTRSAATSMEGRRGAMKLVERFFGTKDRTFWTFQAAGWTGYAMLRTLQAVINRETFPEYLGFVVFVLLLGVGLSLVMRSIYRVVRNMSLAVTLLGIIVTCAGLGLVFSWAELQVGPLLVQDMELIGGIRLLGNAMFEITVLLAWSAIYFGYHYYTSLQEQKEQVLTATAMAHQAQLKMLRYQLNPHFLFNTLNAISTLVLEKSEADANRMLTKLSSFLRYTLVNQPTQRVTLDQEMHALGLYLDIEKVRFQDRLLLEFDIGEKARDALIPSLLLQPLIENAIKYAIAPSIDGGTIKVSADVDEGRLKVALTDTGPGMEDLTNIVSKSGSGVGIANTRERLMQIYGDDHEITLRNMDPTGLGIFIELPCDR
ncbi:histidine kinase [Kordiimonas sp. SCSIO 12603]|uniref:sensor histidine kinase n=1 Tax=Kordiimonas sp. SCSIO 12603 TaxID=2829596 RepID=UPI00210621CE|nr:histidine kinase [Kordiimonas sp. SCSIO 12603]UTW59679.1 histidine kinase [Kordiimonas sp. SCSIO 12603]